MREVTLVLEDGSKWTGLGFGAQASVAGEVVFHTGMVGYHETLTDPSYRGQILVLTYPLVGNYGVPPLTHDEFGLPVGFESDRIQATALVVSEHSLAYSHHAASRSLDAWLAQEGIPGMAGIDTRALTKHLRTEGSMLGKLLHGGEEVDFFDPNTCDVGSEVSPREVSVWKAEDRAGSRPPRRVVLLDCGGKAQIARSLLTRGLEVVRVPHHHYFLNLQFDGLVISNGPGDPKMYTAAIDNIRRTLALGVPIFGICLGHQLLARAIGAETYKMKFGHRSHNQPCIEHAVGAASRTSRCVITSQNHGFAVREDSLPADWRIWFSNANDHTVEGIRHISKPCCAVQFHPEATPGPQDTSSLFDQFVDSLRAP